ncbi:MAG: alpha/beta hydrolase [Bdellovibrionales bacterium]|nr:alpha/beta hydrolase [Bdellovibrionales bacterium]
MRKNTSKLYSLVVGVTLCLVASSFHASAKTLSCRARLLNSTSPSALLSEPSSLRQSLTSLIIKLPKRRKKLETQIYIVQPETLAPEAPVVMLNPGLSKEYFFEQANELARLGFVAVSYNHLNVGTPAVGPLKKPTVEEDSLLALQVYNSLSDDLKSRPLLLSPHSRGALVAGSLAHKLLKQQTHLAGIVAFQPYIYWQLEHLFNQFSSQVEDNINRHLKSLLPFLARILTPIYAKHYDNTAELTAKSLAAGVRDMVFNALVRVQSASDQATESMSLPTVLRMALRQVLPKADSRELENILEKLKAMQPTPSQDAPFLGNYLVGLEIPIQVLSAEEDDLSSLEMAENLAIFASENEMQNISFVTLEGEGHYFPYDKPSTMARMIAEYWRELQNSSNP